MKNLGIAASADNQANVIVDFEIGEGVVVISGAWKDTVSTIHSMNLQKQTVTINVELFGRETPVELSFAEVRKM